MHRREVALFLYDSVGGLLATLIPGFSLDGQRARIMRAYEIICRESLALPLGRRPPDFSRINVDGTPFQFSLSLGPREPPLQFLSEAGVPGSSIADRMKLSKERIRALAFMLQVEEEMSKVFELIDSVAPANDPELLSDAAGALWIGIGFSTMARPKLTIYINGKWGNESKMWARLDLFVSHFDGKEPWDKTRELLSTGMKPLGMAITLSEGSVFSGRAYVSAYGNPLAYYEHLVRSATDEKFYRLFMRFVEAFLGEDRRYPLRSVVCSYGIGKGAETDFKFELCGHCFLASDVQAKEKCLNWSRFMNLDPTMYLQLLEVIANGHLSDTNVDLHSYMGLGLKREDVYSTIYLKPSWTGLPDR